MTRSEMIYTAADALLSGKLAWTEFSLEPTADRAELIDRLDYESDKSLRITLEDAGFFGDDLCLAAKGSAAYERQRADEQRRASHISSLSPRRYRR